MEQVRLTEGPRRDILRQRVAGVLVPARQQRRPVHERQQKGRKQHLQHQ